MKDHKELINDMRELIEAENSSDLIVNAKAAMKKAVDALENYEQDQWNLGPEQPPTGKAVLITIENDGKREVETGIYRELGVRPYIYERGGFLRTGEVVAWRDVPEPYKGD